MSFWPKKRWRVKRWLAHTVPGYPSPTCTFEGDYYFRCFAQIAAAWREWTPDGRGLRYGTLERIEQVRE